MPIIGLILAAVVGYLLGALPSGVIVGRLRGVDPRSGGSGRTGATNALRTLGPVLAGAVLVLDIAKGVAAVLVGGWIGSELGGSAGWGAAVAAIAAVGGHVRSIFIGFTGGRGVATGGGAMLVLAPLAALAAVPVIALVIWRTRYVSLASILAAVTVAVVAALLAVAGWIGLPAAVAATAIGGTVIAAHADNIERLRSGTERRLGSG